ncbi:D-3-phosphoglycerate dehydrogenase [Meiothermus luteus]|jgi:D-3-phosphoglycerate dehydrogenase|uniref:D-3-phosphoglycerate dehydrogenase n=1 Tax=Meiothermus luteus TaxID=2026184 RepID=A0A399EL73_9DEIN|nr:phosphoglycerate dehydrogenase [Meiothermus luteus]RIH85474.1 D-3-phosphoglycerate dehydrogenase [Meiothermus luteus]RMH58193.1 MAG: phosphoglycerate dehydrogenase [Deinococcota bacterium]
MWRILVTDEMRLGEVRHPEVRLDYRPGMAREEILEVIGRYDALITRSRTRVDAELLEAGVNLRVVGRGGVGVDNVDLEAASRRGVLVVNVPEANTRSAAELAWALLLAVARGLVESDRKIREGQWDRKYLGLELDRKTIGIVGLGRIGGQVAKFAKGFDMRVLAYDPYIPRSRAQTLGVELYDDLADMLRQCQFLTVHTPLTEETRGMIGRRELYLLPKGAVVVNAARGGIVDEKALLEVLDEGHLWGAGLDVFVEEPPGVGHPLVHHPKVVHTAHLGANTLEAQERVGEAVLERVIETLQGNLAHALNTGFDPEGLQVFSAWLPLGEALGRLLAQITQGRPQAVEVAFYGEFEKNPDPIASAVAKGLLEQVLGAGAANLVSARPLLRDRGMALVTRRVEQSLDYRQVLEVRLETDREARKARGAVLAGKPRIVGIDDHTVEAVPSGPMLVCVNRDRPGVVGKVGTLLGENGINIAGMQLGRDHPGGHALFVLAIDERPSEEVLEALRGLGVLERVDLAVL